MDATAGRREVTWPGCRLPRTWYRRDALEVAPALLNKVLMGTNGRAARIVEVEAYRGTDDPGSHAYRGRTARNATMWGPPGHLYVYFTYGMHWCANVVCGTDGDPQAVLLRAGEPLAGTTVMFAARQARSPNARRQELCRGPARMCQAFGIGGDHDGADVAIGESSAAPPTARERGCSATGGAWIVDDQTPPPAAPARGPRVGLRAGADLPWRYWVPDSPDISTYRRASRRRPPTTA